MGRQIGFFMAKEDIEDIFAFVKERGDTVLSGKNEPILHLDEELESKYFHSESGFQAFIWRDNLKIVKYDTGYLDSWNSEVVEIMSGGCDTQNRLLHPGRFYVDMKGFREGADFFKNKELDDLYETYRKYVKKYFRKSIGKYTYYIGPKAYELYKSGWKMMSGPKIKIVF